ncbi:MAG: hypothetical protein U1E62_21565 [Alsobacter sp.]
MSDHVGVPTIIEALGVSHLSRVLSQRVSTVSSWKQRGSIPAEYWPGIVLEAKRRGYALSYELLAILHARAKGKWPAIGTTSD